jgi:hypothetical protein
VLRVRDSLNAEYVSSRGSNGLPVVIKSQQRIGSSPSAVAIGNTLAGQLALNGPAAAINYASAVATTLCATSSSGCGSASSSGSASAVLQALALATEQIEYSAVTASAIMSVLQGLVSGHTIGSSTSRSSTAVDTLVPADLVTGLQLVNTIVTGVLTADTLQSAEEPTANAMLAVVDSVLVVSKGGANGGYAVNTTLGQDAASILPTIGR